MRKFIFAVTTIICWSLLSIGSIAFGQPPKNIILIIGDGMGPEHVKAASFYVHGQAGKLTFENFPYRGKVTTHSADSSITDSAAAATAMATGVKVNNGVIALAIPGDGRELKTLLEIYRDRGKSTGLVTTAYLTHATPAAFAAHEGSRNFNMQIGQDYLSQSMPTVLMGGGGHGLTPTLAYQAGYQIVVNRIDLFALDTENAQRVCALFGTEHIPYEFDGLGQLPHLSEMTTQALAILDNNPQGFFLMVEGARMDHAGHNNDLQRNVLETVEFNKTIEAILAWAKGRTDTLIVITADHETGGMTVTQNNGQGNFPTVTWSTGGHTGVNVDIFAWGPHGEKVTGTLDNTEIFSLLNDPDSFRPSTSSSSSSSGTCQLAQSSDLHDFWRIVAVLLPFLFLLLALFFGRQWQRKFVSDR